jgi:large subunit ribosomal protein L21
MKYAIIALGGKQFIVEEGLEIKLERQDKPKTEVLFYKDDKKTLIGSPVLKDVSVKLSKVKDYTEKTDILRFKSKSRYTRRQGHKQPMSALKVDSISLKKKSKKSSKEDK